MPRIIKSEQLGLSRVGLGHVMLSEERAKHPVLTLEKPSLAGTGPFAFAQGDRAPFAALLWESPNLHRESLTFDVLTFDY